MKTGGRFLLLHHHLLHLLLHPLHVVVVALLLVVCCGGWVLGGAHAVRVAGDTRPNLVFVFPDTLRAESFNQYNPAVKKLNVTPFTEEFFNDGTTFQSAHVMHTQCSPSRCTMFSGRYMHVLGHRTQTHLIQDYEYNYLRVLKESGYHVQYYGKNDAFSAAAFNLSVSYWESSIGYKSGDNAFSNPDQPGYFSFLSTGSDVSGADLSNADYKGTMEAVAWMNDTANLPEPFVLFLPSRGAHPPYGAPKEWHTKFTPEDVKAAGIKLRPRNISGMPGYMSDGSGIPFHRNLVPLDDDFFYKIQAVYLGMVSYTDWIFGQLVHGLSKIDGGALLNRTAVIFSSDHGDFGGDYGLVEKWPGSMKDVLTRVPLLARFPGVAGAGHVAQAPVQTADILETMLDLAGVNRTALDSVWVRFANSLRSVVETGDDSKDAGRFVFSEGGFNFQNEQMEEASECLSQCPDGLYCPRGQEEALPNGSPRAAMIRNRTHKLVYRATGVSELYDLVEDPLELNNLYENPSKTNFRDEMRSKLLDWYVQTADVTPGRIDNRGAPKWPHPLPPGDPYADPLVFGLAHDASLTNPFDYLAVNGVAR
eukprot:INCI17580.5.p1 GENE.INCI17580.5~~INCI17580.5.p1  ORF type:complete len:590 (-),score=92.06 INCI17580.5:474-2243(-)